MRKARGKKASQSLGRSFTIKENQSTVNLNEHGLGVGLWRGKDASLEDIDASMFRKEAADETSSLPVAVSRAYITKVKFDIEIIATTRRTYKGQKQKFGSVSEPSSARSEFHARRTHKEDDKSWTR